MYRLTASPAIAGDFQVDTGSGSAPVEQNVRYQHYTLNTVTLAAPQLPIEPRPVAEAVTHSIRSSRAKRKKAHCRTLAEELRTTFMSRVEKKGVHNHRRYSKIYHLLSERGAKIKLINHFTPQQINNYFDNNPVPEGWPETRADDKNSVIAGIGNNTKVKMAIKSNKHGSELVAVKKIYTPKRPSPDTIKIFHDRALRELCLQRRAKSCAPAIYGIAERIDRKKKCHKIYLAMELIKAPKLEDIYLSLSRQQKLTVACSLAKKLHSLHVRHIYAGDFKDTNILVRPDNLQVTVIDFGCSHDLRTPVMMDFVPDGISHYHAPEVYLASRHYCALEGWPGYYAPGDYPGIDKNKLLLPEKADIYSLGILVAKLFSQRPTGKWHILYQTRHLTTPERFDQMTIRKAIVEELDLDLRPLVTKMMRADPAQRPGLPHVIRELEVLAAAPAFMQNSMVAEQKISFGSH